MGSPQLENGFTRIANEILEKLAMVNLSPNEWRVLMVIFRRTYGVQGKKQAVLSNGYIAKGTGLDRSNVVRTVKRLQERKLVSVATLGGINHLGFQKDWRLWEVVSAPTLGVSSDTRAAEDQRKTEEPPEVPSVSTDTRPSVSTDTQERNTAKKRTTSSSSKVKREAAVHPEALRLSDLLARLAEQNVTVPELLNGKRQTTIKRWAADIDMAHRLDGWEWSQLEYVIKWSQQDSFWRTNIRSGAKLRKQMPTMVLRIKERMGNNGSATSGGSASGWSGAMQRALRMVEGENDGSQGRNRVGGTDPRQIPILQGR